MEEHDLCSWVFYHLSEYLDAEMQSDVCAQLEAHLVECPSCRTLRNTMRGTMGMVHDLSQCRMPEECLNRIRERVLKNRDRA